MADRIDTLLTMLRQGQDSALLRFSLGNEYLSHEKYDRAVEHFRAATELDRNYSAAWKMLGRALLHSGRGAEAIDVYRVGIEVAEANGDVQAAKEMTVFLKRLETSAGGGA